ncbi:MAG: 7-carboxy-7-deazaguanine synthase [Bdellovibrionota bacterium]
MAYQVKEVYFTLQGEGLHAGRPAVFCRFAGCNLWNGREEDRAAAVCTFCDTDFVGTNGTGGGTFRAPAELADRILSQWPESSNSSRFVVFTGGEPLLQLDSELLAQLKQRGFQTAVETNGTQEAPPELDWITVSPKAGAPLVLRKGSELKLVYPQQLDPAAFEELDFQYFYLSPLWAADKLETERNVAQATNYCKLHPKWRLNLQRHKYWGIP